MKLIVVHVVLIVELIAVHIVVLIIVHVVLIVVNVVLIVVNVVLIVVNVVLIVVLIVVMIVEKCSRKMPLLGCLHGLAILVFIGSGATVAEQLACSPPTKAIRVQSRAVSLRIFVCGRESCRIIPLFGVFSQGSPISPVLSFRRYSIRQSPLSALKTSMLKAVQIYSLTFRGLLAQIFLTTQCGPLWQPPWLGYCRIFASENRAGQCRWSEGFFRVLRFPPPLHSGAAPLSTHLTLIVSQCPKRNKGAAVAERLACSPTTKANRVQSPVGSLSDFHKWESCRILPMFGRFSRGSLSRGSPVYPAITFRRCSILISLHLIHPAGEPHMLGINRGTMDHRGVKVCLKIIEDEECRAGMKGRREMGGPRENLPTNGVVRHMRKSGVTRSGFSPRPGDSGFSHPACFPPWQTVLKPWLGHSRIFACGNRDGRCRSANFLWDLRSPRLFIPELLNSHLIEPSSALNSSRSIVLPDSHTLHFSDALSRRFYFWWSLPSPLVALLARRLSLKVAQSPKHPCCNDRRSQSHTERN
ncbi:hypothetical protein PR048_014249 [Dryococelus australis]|uniref:Uncharacterized protein n=1 Tax=Dryococelus australis TaxID=614101 RepID=A0ABQ9HE28_9NEOP|nr:hypothetical protein PR048_014249 [Dryococelus australis]